MLVQDFEDDVECEYMYGPLFALGTESKLNRIALWDRFSDEF